MRKSLKRGIWKGLELFLGGVWGGFWERFGTSLASLGALLNVFFQGFVAKRAQEGPRGGQEVCWTRFGIVLERFWEGLGGQNCQKIEIFVIFFDMLFETLILIDFCLILITSIGGMVKNTIFSMGGCWCFWKDLGRKQDASR